MRSIRIALGAMLAAATLAVPAQADVTVGTGGTANCFPFGCLASRQSVGTTFQQVYDASAFGGSQSIDTITFFEAAGGSDLLSSASYDIAFYLTGAAVGGLSTVSVAANQGQLLSSFGSFSLGGRLNDTLSLTGNGFTYDPTQGNLLMQVTMTDVTQANDSGYFRSQPVTGPFSFAIFPGTGTGNFTIRNGLVTNFSATIAAVPEPATWGLMILGFGAVGGALRRRRGADRVFA